MSQDGRTTRAALLLKFQMAAGHIFELLKNTGTCDPVNDCDECRALEFLYDNADILPDSIRRKI